MNAVLRSQSQSYTTAGFASSLSLNAHFFEDTLNGSLLICAVFGSFRNFTGVHSAPLSVTTGGITWTLLNSQSCSDFFLVHDTDHGIVTEYTVGEVAVYYCANAPVVSQSTNVVASIVGLVTGGYPGDLNPYLGCSLMEFTSAAVTAPASIAQIYNDGYNGADITMTAPTDTTVTAGMATTSAGDFIVVAAAPSALFRAAIGFTTGPSTANGSIQIMVNAPGGSVNTAFLTANNMWACIAIGVSGGTLAGGGTVIGACAPCVGPPLLSVIPGFSDLPDSVLMS